MAPKLEIYWIDKFNHECWPANPTRTKPDWAKEFVPKECFDRAVDILRRHNLEYLLWEGRDGNGTPDPKSNDGSGESVW